MLSSDEEEALEPEEEGEEEEVDHHKVRDLGERLTPLALPWRVSPRTCNCPLMNKFCAVSKVTLVDVFNAACTPDLPKLLWYLDRQEICEAVLLARDEQGMTVVHHVSALDDTEPLREIISRLKEVTYLDVMEKNEVGRTPIMVAAGAGNLEMVKMIAAERVRLRSKSKEGLRPVDYAFGHKEVSEWFYDLYAGREELDASVIRNHSRRELIPQNHVETLNLYGDVDTITAMQRGENGNIKRLAEHSLHVKIADDDWSRAGPNNMATKNHQQMMANRRTLSMKVRRSKNKTMRLIPELPLSTEEKAHHTSSLALRLLDTGNVPAAHRFKDDLTGRWQYLETVQKTPGATAKPHVLHQLASKDRKLRLKGELGLLDVKPLSAALLHNKVLTHLQLDDCDIRDEGGAEIVRSIIGNSIEVLVLRRCKLKMKTATALAEFVQSDGCNLAELVLDQNYLTDQGVASICRALVSVGSMTLRQFSCSSNEVGQKKTSSITSICTLLKSEVPLIDLDISWNSIGKTGSQAIMNALEHNTTLEALNMSWNRLGEGGGQRLASVLTDNVHLKRLDFTSTGLQQEDGDALVKAFEMNTTLEMIKLDKNFFGGSMALAMSKVLQRNMVRFSIDSADVHMADVFEEEASVTIDKKFDENTANGRWLLNLSDPSHHKVAQRLVELAEQFDGENWRNERYEGRRFCFEPGYQLPSEGRLELDFFSLAPNDPEVFGVMGDADFRTLCKILQNMRVSISRIALIRQVAGLYTFDAQRVGEMLFCVDSGEEKVTAAIILLQRLTHKENVFLSLVSLSHQSKLEVYKRCGPLHFFDPVRCTKEGFKTRYRLDVSKLLDHRFLYKLIKMYEERPNTETELRFERVLFDGGEYTGPWCPAMYNTNLFDYMAKSISLPTTPLALSHQASFRRVATHKKLDRLVSVNKKEDPGSEGAKTADPKRERVKFEDSAKIAYPDPATVLAGIGEDAKEEGEEEEVFHPETLDPTTWDRWTFNVKRSFIPQLPLEGYLEFEWIEYDRFDYIVDEYMRTTPSLPSNSPLTPLGLAGPLSRPATMPAKVVATPIAGTPHSARARTVGSKRRGVTPRRLAASPESIEKKTTASSTPFSDKYEQMTNASRKKSQPKYLDSESDTPKSKNRRGGGIWTMVGDEWHVGVEKHDNIGKPTEVHRYPKLDLADVKKVTKALEGIVGNHKNRRLEMAAKRKKDVVLGVVSEVIHRWACPVCQMQFVQEGNLMFHIDSVHLQDDNAHWDFQRRTYIDTKCQEVEDRLANMRNIIHSEKQIDAENAQLRMSKEADEAFFNLLNFYDEDYENSEATKALVKAKEVVQPHVGVSGLEYMFLDSSWKFKEEIEGKGKEKDAPVEDECDEKDDFFDLDQVVMSHRQKLLRKYRDGVIPSPKLQAPDKLRFRMTRSTVKDVEAKRYQVNLTTSGLRRQAAMEKLKQEEAAAYVLLNSEEMDAEHRRVVQENHSSLLSWMDA